MQLFVASKMVIAAVYKTNWLCAWGIHLVKCSLVSLMLLGTSHFHLQTLRIDVEINRFQRKLGALNACRAVSPVFAAWTLMIRVSTTTLSVVFGMTHVKPFSTWH
jgi:hypothetical protein